MSHVRFIGASAAVIAVAVAVAAASATQTVDQALASFESDMRNYNLVTPGRASFANFGDTEAGIAVGGALSIAGSGTIASQPGNFGVTSDPTMYVAGAVSIAGSVNLNGGYAALPGTSSGSWTWNQAQETLSTVAGSVSSINAGSTQAATNPIDNPGPSNWNWTTIQSDLQTASNTLAAATATGTISVSSQNLMFTAPGGTTAGSVVVFDLNAANLSSNAYNGQTISNVSISVPADVTYVVNVVNASGATIFGSGVNFNSGTNDNALLWNFEGSSSVTLGGDTFYGAILAPGMGVSNTNSTVLDGQVDAAAFADAGAEMHYTAFDSFAAASIIPEVSAYAWWGLAVCGAGAAVKTARKRRGRR